MAAKAFNLDIIKMVRSIRSGAPKGNVCDAFRISSGALEDLENIYRSVPDNTLARMERVLRDDEKLRNLMTRLVRPLE
jgi:hypothetical protein